MQWTCVHDTEQSACVYAKFHIIARIRCGCSLNCMRADAWHGPEPQQAPGTSGVRCREEQCRGECSLLGNTEFKASSKCKCYCICACSWLSSASQPQKCRGVLIEWRAG